MECCISLRRLSMVECPSRVPYVRVSLLLAKRPEYTTRSDLQVRARFLPPRLLHPLRHHTHPNNRNQRNWANMIPCGSVLLDGSVEMASALQEQLAPPSSHAIDSKPKRRRSITMPGQVSSASTAHHSRPMTRTGRTRKGRLISPRLATKDVCFRSAFFTIRTVPLFTRTTIHRFPFGVLAFERLFEEPFHFRLS
jgi:hypothetical protein